MLLTVVFFNKKDKTMKEDLQTWYRAWLKEHENTDLIYVSRGRDGVYLSQVHFVRDTLSRIMWNDLKYEDIPETDNREKITGYVIGEHKSKSVRLPVYMLERKDLGIKFILRDNYYNWNVSVVSDKPITTDLKGLVKEYGADDRPNYPGAFWGYCFFEGFPVDYCFGSYSENQNNFSTYLNNDYELYTFIWLIMRDLIK